MSAWRESIQQLPPRWTGNASNSLHHHWHSVFQSRQVKEDLWLHPQKVKPTSPYLVRYGAHVIVPAACQLEIQRGSQFRPTIYCVSSHFCEMNVFHEGLLEGQGAVICVFIFAIGCLVIISNLSNVLYTGFAKHDICRRLYITWMPTADLQT